VSEIQTPNLSLVGFIYDFDKVIPFSVSEIQTPNLSLPLVGFIYDFDKVIPFSVSEIQTPNLSLVGISIYNFDKLKPF
jgi:hypothetical protein